MYPEVEFIRRPRHDEVHVIRIYASGKREIVVEREMNMLTLDEAREHGAEVRQAMVDELQRWISLGAFRRFPNDQAKNVIDSRCVLKWEQVVGKHQIKARLTVRGFKDLQGSELSTFAGTTSR